ncbi:MAG: hypothetical protein GY762_13600 [Proteobacteria bacterium]|nr:hypothetical protein [Pseudomonadota bacterium]
MKYLIICLSCGIAVMTMAASVLAQEVDLYDDTVFPKSDPSPEGKGCINDGNCPNRRVCFQNRCMTQTQRTTIQTNAKNLIIPGAILTAVGGVMTIVASIPSLWFYGIGELEVGVIGFSSFITGAILLTIGLVKRRRIKRGEFGFNINTKRRRITLEPAIAAGENGGVFGLSGRF